MQFTPVGYTSIPTAVQAILETLHPDDCGAYRFQDDRRLNRGCRMPWLRKDVFDAAGQ